MTMRNLFRLGSVLLALSVLSPAAHAALFRAYLASDGNDANPCTIASPCRLLPAALAAVSDGGEIWILDSANYNTATVNVAKSVTILAIPGVVGSVVATGGPAIVIGTAGVAVTLRNLVIVPLAGAGGTYGIFMTAGDRLTLEGCLLAGLPGIALFVNAAAEVHVADSTIRDGGNHGIQLQGSARAGISRTTITGNTSNGVALYTGGTETTSVDIVDSVINRNDHGVAALNTHAAASLYLSVFNSQLSGNHANGMTVNTSVAASGGPVTLAASNNIVTNVLASPGSAGIAAFNAGAKVWASGNTVSGNNYGLYNYNAIFETAGNNAVRNNTVNTSGTITVIATQ
jgi:hypothetical protein